MRKIIYIILRSAKITIDHDGIEHAGYMAFLNLLSLFPFLVFIVALTGAFGHSSIGEKFLEIFLTSLPSDLMEAISPRIIEIMSGPPEGLITLSIIGAIWTASSSVEGLRTILNRVYEVRNPPKYILRRLLSIIQFITITIIVIVSTLLLIFLPLAYDQFISILHINFDSTSLFYIDFLMPISHNARYLAFICTLFFVVIGLFYTIPNKRMYFKYLCPGAFITVIGWLLSGYILSLYYINLDQISIIYGSLGSIIATMLFFYFINLIFIYGAELNYQLQTMR